MFNKISNIFAYYFVLFNYLLPVRFFQIGIELNLLRPLSNFIIDPIEDHIQLRLQINDFFLFAEVILPNFFT